MRSAGRGKAYCLGSRPALALVLFLVGCGGPSSPPPAKDREALVAAYRDRADRLATLAGWLMVGRATLERGHRSGQVRIRWSQRGEEGQLKVRNPFGQTLMALHYDESDLQLQDRRGRTYRNQQARSVLRQRLGGWVPVDRFSGWALGLAPPSEGIPRDLGAHGLPHRLALEGWSIVYTAYRQVGAVWLPQVLEASREGIGVRIQVDRWELRWQGKPKTEGQA